MVGLQTEYDEFKNKYGMSISNLITGIPPPIKLKSISDNWL